jgi:hypothetical protein
MLYDKHHGIEIESEAYKLLGPVLHHKEEEITNPTSLTVLMDAYVENEINAIYHISLKEFLELNTEEMSFMIKHSIDVRKKKSAVQDTVMREIEKGDI